MKVRKGNKTIEVTEKSYRVLYKEMGYELIKDEVKEVETTDMTKAEIISELENKGIEHDPKSLKKELSELLGSD